MSSSSAHWHTLTHSLMKGRVREDIHKWWKIIIIASSASASAAMAWWFILFIVPQTDRQRERTHTGKIDQKSCWCASLIIMTEYYCCFRTHTQTEIDVENSCNTFQNLIFRVPVVKTAWCVCDAIQTVNSVKIEKNRKKMIILHENHIILQRNFSIWIYFFYTLKV